MINNLKKIILLAIVLIQCAIVSAKESIDLPKPVFSISFEKGLAADFKNNDKIDVVEGKWEFKGQQPLYQERGLTGKALKCGGTNNAVGLKFDAPCGTQDHGTLLFWTCGLKGWNLFTSIYDDKKARGSELLSTWGRKGGWSNITKWAYDTGGLKINFANHKQIFYGHNYFFDQYRWTQIGLSWNNDKVNLYLNGDMIAQDTVSPFPFESFSIRGKDSEDRLIDNCKIWNRVLAPSEIKRIYRLDLNLSNRPLVSAPRMIVPPKIDGKVDIQEWANAAKLTGLLEACSGELAKNQSSFQLGWDNKYIYVAMSGMLTKQAALHPEQVYGVFTSSKQTMRDVGLTGDDAVKLLFSPKYFTAGNFSWPMPLRKVGTPINDNNRYQKLADWSEYLLEANAAGTSSDVSYNSRGQQPNWNSEWTTASSVTPGGWQFEARIPLISLQKQLPAPGDKWGMQLERVWEHLKKETDLWSWGYRLPNDTEQAMYINQANKVKGGPIPGILRFAKPDEPIIRVDKIGECSEQNIDFVATLINPASIDKEFIVKLFTDTKNLQYKEKVVLQAGKSFKFRQQHKITDYSTSRLTFEVSSSSGQVIHRTNVPFYLKQQFSMLVRHYPNYQKFMLDLDMSSFMRIPIKNLSFDLCIKDLAGKTVYKDLGHKPSSYDIALEYSTKTFIPGDYVLSMVILNGKKVLAQKKIDFTNIKQAEWFNNRYGFEDIDNDKVPYPWTDMKIDQDIIQVWGRQYQFGKGLFPYQITILDNQHFLRSPIRILLKTADGKMVDSSKYKAKSKWTKKGKAHIEGTRCINMGSISLTNNLWAEYDGFVWNTLTLNSSKPITITSLELEINVTSEFSDVQLRNWLGNGDGGIQWFGGKKYQIKQNPAGSTLLISLIDEPTKITTAHDFKIGFIATPVRPKIWRTPEYHYPLADKNGFAAYGGGPWYPKGLEFMPAADIGKNFYGSKYARIYVHTSPVNTGSDDSKTEDFKNYGYEWLANPRKRLTGNEPNVYSSLSSKSYRDYFVWRHWRFMKKYGYSGLYFDNPRQDILGTREVLKRLYNVTLSNNELNSWEQPIGIAANGNIDMSHMGFANYHWDGEHLNSPILQWKTYRGHITPESFRNEYMGHNLGWPVTFLGQGRMKNEWVEADGGAVAVADYISGLVLLHDQGGKVGWQMKQPREKACERFSRAIAKHNFNHWIFQFVPYWKQAIVKMPRKNIYASFYLAQPSKLINADDKTIDAYFEEHQARKLPRSIRIRNREAVRKSQKVLKEMKPKAIMIVYNDTDWEGVMRLKLNWKKLGLGAPEDLKAENAVHSTGFRIEKVKDKNGREVEKAVFFKRPEEYAKIENSEVVFPMTKYNYRMIVLEKNKKLK